MRARQFCVYILASHKRVLYIGVTNDLERRLAERRQGVTAGFTSRYAVNKLVHFEQAENPLSAVAREKEIKGWRREKKIRLIDRDNPQWNDLSRDW